MRADVASVSGRVEDPTGTSGLEYGAKRERKKGASFSVSRVRKREGESETGISRRGGERKRGSRQELSRECHALRISSARYHRTARRALNTVSGRYLGSVHKFDSASPVGRAFAIRA